MLTVYVRQDHLQYQFGTSSSPFRICEHISDRIHLSMGLNGGDATITSCRIIECEKCMKYSHVCSVHWRYPKRLQIVSQMCCPMNIHETILFPPHILSSNRYHLFDPATRQSIRVLWWYPDVKWVPIMAQYIESLHTSFISRTVREISLSRLYFTWMKRKTNKNRQQPINSIFSFCFFSFHGAWMHRKEN